MYRTLVYLVFSQLAVGGLLSMLVVPLEAGKRFFPILYTRVPVFLLVALRVGPFPILTPLADGATDSTLPRRLLLASALLALIYLLAVVAERIKPQNRCLPPRV